MLKYKYTNTLILLFILTFNVQAVGDVIGSGFSYQGELNQNGAPANGLYYIRVAIFLAENGGAAITFLDFPQVTVTDGLFNIPEVDFGDAMYAGQELWLQLFVKKADDPAFVQALLPRQRLSAVPYAVQAEFLAAGAANNGDILKFDGNNWVGEAVNLSPWSLGSGQIAYSGGKVGIGTANPNATLHVSGDAAGDPLRVQVGSATKLVLKNNGGTSLGVNGTPPSNGLYVQGDAKQHRNANGFLKYMVSAYCSNGTASSGFAAPASLNRYVNNVNSSNITIANGSNEGECVISFPTDISQRYWQTSVIVGSDLNINKGASCRLNTSTSLRCFGVKLSNGNRLTVNMMVLVY